MIRSVRPALAGLPHGGTEDHDGQEEEHTHNFKPDDAADAAEGAQEAPDPATDSPGSLAGNHAGGAGLGGYGGGACGMGRGRRLAGSGLGAGGNLLAGDTSSDAKSDAESAADGLRFHPDFDGNSVGPGTAFQTLPPVPGCSEAA